MIMIDNTEVTHKDGTVVMTDPGSVSAPDMASVARHLYEAASTIPGFNIYLPVPIMRKLKQATLPCLFRVRFVVDGQTYFVSANLH